MSKFLLRRKYFQRHLQLLNSIAIYYIAFTFKAIMEDGEIVDRKSTVKTLPSHILLFDRDQNCFCVENLKLIFWKTGKRVKNILIDLSPFSCLAPEPTLSEHSSHTFTTLPMVKPFSPWSTFVWWVLNTKPAIFTQHLKGREINKSSSLSQIFRQQCHFPRSFQRRYIRFLFISPGLLHKMSRQHWSTQLVDCKMLVFQISFFLVCRIYLKFLLVILFLLFCDVVSQDCLIFVTACALVVLTV